MPEISEIPDGHVTAPRGFLAGAVAAGIKSTPGALDLALLYSERECSVAGVFTRNLVRSAPVGISESRVRAGGVRAVIVNSGCANALTGDEGVRDAEEMTDLAARQLGLEAREVAIASTGLTGARMPMAKVRAALPSIALTRTGGSAFARAIMTTDTVPKEVALAVADGEHSYTVAGCAKGSGMIHPDMATMLAYVTTDAAVEPAFLKSVLREVADATINMVTVDGDTSCSDTLLVFANGAVGGDELRAGTAAAALFQDALLQVCTALARKLARDGEGASRLLEVEVTGAASLEDARKVARTVANSSLVKTAVAGNDPNWGRVLVAAGRSGAAVEERKASLWMQGCLLFDRGRPSPFSEPDMRQRLEAEEVRLRIDLCLGDATAKAWGCDLTTEYVHINADYTT